MAPFSRIQYEGGADVSSPPEKAMPTFSPIGEPLENRGHTGSRSYRSGATGRTPRRAARNYARGRPTSS
jgi:hypothetical protein